MHCVVSTASRQSGESSMRGPCALASALPVWRPQSSKEASWFGG
jgi:hypothetical protein